MRAKARHGGSWRRQRHSKAAERGTVRGTQALVSFAPLAFKLLALDVTRFYFVTSIFFTLIGLDDFAFNELEFAGCPKTKNKKIRSIWYFVLMRRSMMQHAISIFNKWRTCRPRGSAHTEACLALNAG